MDGTHADPELDRGFIRGEGSLLGILDELLGALRNLVATAHRKNIGLGVGIAEAGAPTLLVENPGNLSIIELFGELANELDIVGRGGSCRHRAGPLLARWSLRLSRE